MIRDFKLCLDGCTAVKNPEASPFLAISAYRRFWRTLTATIGESGRSRFFCRCAIALAAFALPAAAQQKVAPDCVIDFSFTAAGQTQGAAGCGNNTAGVVQWTLWYKSTGFSALSLRVESAPDNSGAPGTWGAFAGMIVAGVNPNTAITQNSTMLSGFEPWVRVILTSKTGTGTVTGQLYGCRQPGCAGGIEVVTAILGISDVNLVEVAGAATDANAGTAGPGTLRVAVASDQTFTTPLPENLKQINGTTVAANSGAADGGTIRVVIATDQPSPTNPFPENLKQINGTTVAANSGAADGGTIRVVIATDQPSPTNPFPENLKQINGTTVDANSGTKSAGTQRVVAADDQPLGTTTPFTTQGAAASGAAPSGNPVAMGFLQSGATGGLMTLAAACQNSTFINVGAATTARIVTGVSGRRVRFCAFSISLASLGTWFFSEGTGSNCGTGNVPLTVATSLLAGTPQSVGSGLGMVFQGDAGQDICITTAGAGATAAGFFSFSIY